MGRPPLVSVVTACYRHEPYLDDYFRGLLAQTYSDIEIVFIDDGSPDGSWEKALGYRDDLRANFARVVMLNQENRGMHATFQRALGLATGEFICILESDDYFLPTRVGRAVDHLLRSPEDGFVHGDVHVLYGDRVVPGLHRASSYVPPTGWVFEDLLRANPVVTCSACVRAEALRKYGRLTEYASRGYLMADHPLWLDLARHVRFGYIPDPLACYRVLDESASHSRDDHRQARFFLSGFRIRLDYLRDASLASDDVAAFLYRELTGHAYWMREAQLYPEALAAYRMAARLSPLRLAAYLGTCKLLPHAVLARLGLRRKDRTLFEAARNRVSGFGTRAFLDPRQRADAC